MDAVMPDQRPSSPTTTWLLWSQLQLPSPCGLRFDVVEVFLEQHTRCTLLPAAGYQGLHD